MAQALYRKYRPTSLAEVIGQTHVTDVLAQTLKKGRVSHAYLLTGPKGTGKTSIARILAHEINNIPYSSDGHLDIIEIDAASNNGVDDVRDLREKVSIVPVSAAKKVYIIDEVHMLSRPAFNALLKTLEEPPGHVIFILATTEVHKLPETILSRTQRFHFRLIEASDMKSQLSSIAQKEKINVSDGALKLIASRARGSFRDGISLLDQLSNMSEKNITVEMVETTLGLANNESIERLIDVLIHRHLQETVELLYDLEQEGISPVVLSEQLSHRLRDFIVVEPRLIVLIEALIEVGRSYDPQLKLLAVVAANASSDAEKPARSIALKTAARPIIAVVPPAQKVVSSSDPLRAYTASPKKTLREKPIITDIEWPDVLDHVRAHHLALYGVLKKAEARYKNGVLNLHFSYSLHQKKLEDGKYRQMLGESLIALYKEAPTITLTSGKLPPKNEQAAAVAAIMGGGEEVNIES